MTRPLLLWITCLFALGMILAACETDNPFLPAEECLITANVDGTDFRWELGSCSYVGETLGVGDITFDEAELELGPITGPGVYASSDLNLNLAVLLTISSGLQIVAADIRVEVTTFNSTEAEGNFSGLFTDIDGDVYQVENGYFRAVF